MAGRLINKKSGSWGVKNGPGFLLFIAGAALLITILIWRSDLPWKVAALVLFILLMIFLLFFGQQINAIFDVDRRNIHISRRRIWKKAERTIPFDDVHTVAVVSSSRGTTTRTFKVILVLNSGEQVQVTAHASSGKLAKKKLAQKISDTLNQFRSQPITPALEGFIRVVREGNTNGTPWSVNLITANDSTPITQWISKKAYFKDGFLLLIPAESISLSAAGELSKSTRFFYKRYLRNLMIEDTQIAGFEDAVMLQKGDHLLGNRFTCISNDPAFAATWISRSMADKISSWIDNSPLSGGKAEKEPHILVTSEKTILSFRKLYHQDEQIQYIADFGVSLIEDYL